MRRYLQLALAILFCIIGSNVFGYDIAVKNDDGVTIYYNRINDTELEVTYEKHYLNDAQSYYGYEDLKELSISDTIIYNEKKYIVTRIGSCAFFRCTKLKSINLPNSLTSIESGAFQYCGLPSISIPDNVTILKKAAFYRSSLRSITIGKSVREIGQDAFYECYALDTISIPTCLTYIGQSAFRDCKMSNVFVFVDNSSALYDSTVLLLIKNHINKPVHLIDKNNNEINEFVFPDSVKNIKNYALYNCSSLKSIIIPQNVISIGDWAFSGCTGLASFNIPNNVMNIGNNSFYNTCIKSLTIGTGVQNIGKSAFDYETNIGANPVKTIWLTNTPPSGYSYAAGLINYVANDLYTSLSNRIVYPFLSSIFDVDGVKFVPVSPSERLCDAIDCNYDESAVNVHISPTVSYKGVNMTVKDINPYTCYENNFIKNVKLTFNGNVGEFAFFDCDSIINVFLSNNGNIGTKAFYNCKNINIVELSNNGNVEESAFENCDGIKTIIASNIGNIETKAFYDCDGVINIDLSNNGYIGTQAFYSCYALKTAKIHNNRTIGIQAFAECTSLETCSLGDNLTEIKSSSFQNCSSLQKIVIPNSVDLLGESAFQGCSEMLSAIIGDGVKSIYQNAFRDCTSLKSVIIGNGTETIGKSAFANCSSLTNVQAGNQISEINTYAFQNCSALPQIEIPSSVTSISDYTFSGCISLATVLIANRENELKLGSNGSNPLFSSCPLDSVYIGGNITYQTSSKKGYSPFYRNTSLRTIHITDKETEISDNEFYGCTNLKNVRIGDGVTTIGKWAFSGCSSLDYFAFGSKVETIGQEAFSDCTAMTQLYSSAKTPPICGSQALDDINKWNCTLHVPTGCVADYQAANQWKEFFFIDEITTQINNVATESYVTNNIREIYDLQGKKRNSLQPGFNIIRMKDGTTKKMLMKKR